jgi:hypothetical protein
LRSDGHGAGQSPHDARSTLWSAASITPLPSRSASLANVGPVKARATSGMPRRAGLNVEPCGNWLNMWTRPFFTQAHGPGHDLCSPAKAVVLLA